MQAVSLGEAKSHLKATDDEDLLITSYLKAANAWAEGISQRVFCEQKWDVFIEDWPASVILPVYPVQAVDSISYKDSQGNYQDLDSSAFIQDLNLEPSEIHFTGELPSLTSDQSERIRIRLSCGHTSGGQSEENQRAALDARIPAAVLLKIADMHLYREDREKKGSNETAAESLLNPLRHSIS